MSLLLLLACASEPASEVDLALARAARSSLVLRGYRPGVDELERVLADPSSVDELQAEWLASGELGARVGSALDEVFRTRSEAYPQDPAFFGAEDPVRFHRSIGEELPRFVAEVVDQDLPWTELVLADWTMADEQLEALWPVRRDDPQQGGWGRARYLDDRPAAGILSMTSFYWRYDSTPSNANRRRAGHMARALLCHDLAGQQVTFDLDQPVSDEADLEAAVATEPACVSCHLVLDPLGAHMFGFFFHDPDNPADASWYHPEREGYWQTLLGQAPAYYGQESEGLEQLAAHLAADPRLPGCLVENLWSGMLGQDPALADTDALLRHREAMVSGGGTVRAALASMVADPDFHRDLGSTLLSPRQLGDTVQALTGYAWTVDGVPALESDLVGVRSLAGGFDGMVAARRARSPGPTLVLVQQRLAEAAAAHAVAEDPAGLFSLVAPDQDASADPDLAREQLEHLVLAVLSRRPQDGEVDSLLALWEQLASSEGSSEAAWGGVLTALLRHPDLVLH